MGQEPSADLAAPSAAEVKGSEMSPGVNAHEVAEPSPRGCLTDVQARVGSRQVPGNPSDVTVSMAFAPVTAWDAAV